jgi:hypothetical protein
MLPYVLEHAPKKRLLNSSAFMIARNTYPEELSLLLHNPLVQQQSPAVLLPQMLVSQKRLNFQRMNKRLCVFRNAKFQSP